MKDLLCIAMICLLVGWMIAMVEKTWGPAEALRLETIEVKP